MGLINSFQMPLKMWQKNRYYIGFNPNTKNCDSIKSNKTFDPRKMYESENPVVKFTGWIYLKDIEDEHYLIINNYAVDTKAWFVDGIRVSSGLDIFDLLPEKQQEEIIFNLDEWK